MERRGQAGVNNYKGTRMNTTASTVSYPTGGVHILEDLIQRGDLGSPVFDDLNGVSSEH
jgi:hypothetical protein